jgi:hypothetical protein
MSIGRAVREELERILNRGWIEWYT